MAVEADATRSPPPIGNFPEKTSRREFGDAEKNIQDLRIAARHIFPGDVFSCSSPPLPVPIGYLLHMS